MSSEFANVTHGDWMLFERGLRALYAEGLSMENFVERGLAAVGSLVPGEFVTYSRAREPGPEGGQGEFDIVFSTKDQLPLEPLMAFMRIKNEYALWRPDLDLNAGKPSMLRDGFSRRGFEDTAMFTEAYRPFGLDNHFSIPIMLDAGAVVHFSVQRKGGADFTERDREVIELLQPHLRSARLLARERAGSASGGPELYAGLGLSPREAEVFHWLVEGKRNTEIATILRIGEQTIKSHVANIFNKLGLESRHAAIRRGLEFVRQLKTDELRAAEESLRTFRLKRDD